MCTQEVAVKPTLQSAKAVSDQSDIKKCVCSKKATLSLRGLQRGRNEGSYRDCDGVVMTKA